MTDDALIATIALDEWLAAKARIAELEAALRTIADKADEEACIARAALNREAEHE